MSGMRRTHPFQWEGSRPGHCSTNPGWELPTISVAMAETVLRGGWGRFFYHSGQFTAGLDASAGVKNVTINPTTWVGGPGCPTNPPAGSSLIAGNLSCFNVAATPATPAAVDSTDNNQPNTDSYSVNLDQQTPWQGLLEIGYVGNHSRDQLNQAGGVGSSFNLVPYGAMLSATNPGHGQFQQLSPVAGLRQRRPSH